MSSSFLLGQLDKKIIKFKSLILVIWGTIFSTWKHIGSSTTHQKYQYYIPEI